MVLARTMLIVAAVARMTFLGTPAHLRVALC